MSYNTDLQNNNTFLQEILATIESLPEAGSDSGMIETCTVEINNYAIDAEYLGILTYQDGSFNIETYNALGRHTIDNVVVNSLLVIIFTGNGTDDILFGGTIQPIYQRPKIADFIFQIPSGGGSIHFTL